MSGRKRFALIALVLTALVLVAVWHYSYIPCAISCEGAVAMDCMWQQQASAWLDVNENGVQDADEQPLSGVRFFIDDVYNGFSDVGNEAFSDADGKAALEVWLPGCPRTDFEVYAQPTAAYRLTTPERLPDEAETFAFGFVPEAD